MSKGVSVKIKSLPLVIKQNDIDGCTDHGDDNKSTIGSPISGFIHRFE
jgi:hypothetical protein